MLARVLLAAKSRPAPGFDDRLLDETVSIWGEGVYATVILGERNTALNERLQTWVSIGVWHTQEKTHGYWDNLIFV